LDIKPSEIVPLLKISIEFAKASYEDEAFKIEFYSQATSRLKEEMPVLLRRFELTLGPGLNTTQFVGGV